MLDLFETHRYDIKVSNVGQPIHIVPIGDVHWGSPQCSVSEFKQFAKDAEALPNVHYIFLGDTHDLASTSERELIEGLHESTQDQLDAMAKVECDKFTNIVKHAKGRTIGFIEGNHHARFMDGSTSTMRMAQQLGGKYLGGAAMIRLAFSYGTCCTSLDILAYHGKGGGQLAGSPFNILEKDLNGWEVDIVMSGHDHKRGCIPKPRVALQEFQGEMVLRDKRRLMIKTGTFLKGYEPGKRSYATRRLYSPLDLGGVVIQMTPRRDRNHGKGFHIETKVIV